MAVKWFLVSNEQTEGPFLSEDVQNRYANGKLTSDTLIWGTGAPEWRSIAAWAQDLGMKGSTLQAEATSVGTTVAADQTAVMSSDSGGATQTTVLQPLGNEPGANETWHFASGGKSFGPFNRTMLISELKKLEQMNDVVLWTKGMKEWASLFEFHELLSQIGVNKRTFPRADLQGTANIKTDKGATMSAPLITISEGGVSVAASLGLKAGMIVELEIVSEVFAAPISIKAEVRYVMSSLCGMKFQSPTAETKAAISAFVRDNPAAAGQTNAA